MSVMEQRQSNRVRRSFTDEFKADAVLMVLDDERRIVDVADALGIGYGTLGNWVLCRRRHKHDLRHSHVALLIAEGAHPAVIASRLGHTSVKTVVDVYGHL